MTNLPLIIDFFCGSGGLSLGFKQAGFPIWCGVDIDKDCANTYEKNIGQAWTYDIRNLTIDHLFAEDQPIPETIVLSGFPCQGFSTAGLRDPDDPRSQLYKEMLRLIKKIEPIMICCENVQGLMTMERTADQRGRGQCGNVMLQILQDLELAGYKMNWRLLNCAEYGVPQKRQRVFMIGIRRDWRRGFEFPNPTHPTEEEQVTAGQALIDLEEPDEFFPSFPQELDDVFKQVKWNAMFKPASRGPYVKPPHQDVFTNSKLLTLIKAIKGNYKQGQKLIDPRKPSLTVMENHGNNMIVAIRKDGKHYVRRTTIREMLRLQSFPDDFTIFPCSKASMARQTCYAVPPLMAYHLAEEMKNMYLMGKRA